MRRLAFEGTLPFEGYHGSPSHCYIRGYVAAGAPPLVIATEMPDNPGTSVTNRAELLATWALGRFGPDDGDPAAGRIVWVEHYPATRHCPEHFRRVWFEWDGQSCRFRKPTWAAITRRHVEELVGGPLPPLPFDAPPAVAAPAPGGRYGRLYQPSAN